MTELLEQQLSRGPLSRNKGRQLHRISRRLGEYWPVGCIGKCLCCRFRAEVAGCYALVHILDHVVNFEFSGGDSIEQCHRPSIGFQAGESLVSNDIVDREQALVPAKCIGHRESPQGCAPFHMDGLLGQSVPYSKLAMRRKSASRASTDAARLATNHSWPAWRPMLGRCLLQLVPVEPRDLG